MATAVVPLARHLSPATGHVRCSFPVRASISTLRERFRRPRLMPYSVAMAVRCPAIEGSGHSASATRHSYTPERFFSCRGASGVSVGHNCSR